MRTPAKTPSPTAKPTDFAANIETGRAQTSARATRPAATEACELVSTPNVRSIEELCAFFGVTPEQTLKTLLVAGSDEYPVALMLLRGDHELNAVKAERSRASAHL